MISFGFTFFAEDKPVVEEVVTVASTEEAKRLTGRDEAEETIGEAIKATAAAWFSTTAGIGIGGAEAGISKTARHIGHLKGASPIFDFNYYNDCNHD